MPKPEWEKTRDTMDFIAASNGRASTGVWGAMGAQAHQGRKWSNTAGQAPKKSQTRVQTGPVSQRETDKAASLIGTGPVTPDWVESMIGIMVLIGAVAGLGVGAWFGATDQLDAFASLPGWKRTLYGAGIGALTGGAGIVLVGKVLMFAVHTLLPILLRLAGIAIVLGGIYLVLSGRI